MALMESDLMENSLFITNTKKNGILRWIITALVMGMLLLFLQRLLSPKYEEKYTEGGMTGEFYSSDLKHDVLFVGDCEVYNNFSTVTLWQEYGINSYIRGSGQQLIWQSFYLLEDALRYEKPQVVVFNVQSMQYDLPQREAYNRMTLDGMRWSLSKIRAISASMTDEEHFIEYIFPILRYHSRWNELQEEDFEYLFHRDKHTYNGYELLTGSTPMENLPPVNLLPDYSFGQNARNYLEKMRVLCEKEGITLILIKAPGVYPVWHEEWNRQIEEYAKANNLAYYNFLENTDEIGIDYQTDTFDAGEHLNVRGAEKLSRFFGRILKDDYSVPNRKDDAFLNEYWNGLIERYEKEKCGENIPN